MGITKKIKIERNRIRPKDSEVERLVCDNSFLLKNSNWKPQYTLNDGLVETIKWVKEEYRKKFKNDKYIL